MPRHSSSAVVFSCKGLTKHFTEKQDRLSALQDVSFSISHGEFVCVLGPSGCGKSTLLRIMAGLIPRSAGEMHFSRPASARPHTAMVFQSQGLLPWMNVLDNVAFGLEMQGVDKRTAARPGARIPGEGRAAGTSSTPIRIRSPAACVSASPSCAPSWQTPRSC